MNAMTTPSDGRELVNALVAAGWTIVGERAGAYARLSHHNSHRDVIVPFDRTAPEYAEDFDAAVNMLVKMAHCGRSAQQALDSLRYAGVIT